MRAENRSPLFRRCLVFAMTFSEFDVIVRIGVSVLCRRGSLTRSEWMLYRRSLGPDDAALVKRFGVSDLQETNPQFHRNCGYN
jgi:hypothetical protein